MATLSYPFTSHLSFDEHGQPLFDRAVDAEFMRSFYMIERNNGIIQGGDPDIYTDAYKVQATTPVSMSVEVLPGHAFIQGAYSMDPELRTLELETAHPTLNRIDTIVLRLNLTDAYRNIDLYVKKGVASSNPVAPALQRDAEIYELGLADVTVTASTITIPQANILDTRANPTRCGESTTGADMTQIANRILAPGLVVLLYQIDLTPFEMWGVGVWEQLYGIPRGADDFNLVGSDTHTLTEAQLAEHTHNATNTRNEYLGQYSNILSANGVAYGTLATSRTPNFDMWQMTISPAGQNAPHNNLPRSQNMRMYGRRY